MVQSILPETFNNEMCLTISILYIQVAKQCRTVPVSGCDAERGFDAEKCDLGNCAFPPLPPPQFFRLC